MRLHLVIDRFTGEVQAQGRSGRRYSPEEIARAEARGESDPHARAVLDDLVYEGAIDPAALLHDCPECRAAAARGEQPLLLSGDALEAALAAAVADRTRWRHRRRGRR